MNRRCWHWTAVVGLAVVVVATMMVGCEDTPEAKLTEGKRALADRDLEEAERYLEAVLDVDPELVEARRLLATTRIRAGEFEAAERKLEALWDGEGLQYEGQLSAEERQTRQLLSEQFGQLYRRWLESIDPDDDPEKFEEIALTGLERNSRDSELNTRLVEFYEQRADRFIERGELIRAAEMLEGIDDLYRFPDIRRQARERAEGLRREAFDEEARERFEQQLQPNLVDTGAYDPETETVTMAIEQPLDRGLDPEDDDAIEQARNTAIQTLMPTLTQFVSSMGEVDGDEIDAGLLDVPRMRLTDEDFERGDYRMTIAVDLDDVIDMAFGYVEYRRTAGDEARGQRIDDDGGELAVDDAIELDTSAVDGDR